MDSLFDFFDIDESRELMAGLALKTMQGVLLDNREYDMMIAIYCQGPAKLGEESTKEALECAKDMIGLELTPMGEGVSSLRAFNRTEYASYAFNVQEVARLLSVLRFRRGWRIVIDGVYRLLNWVVKSAKKWEIIIEDELEQFVKNMRQNYQKNSIAYDLLVREPTPVGVYYGINDGDLPGLMPIGKEDVDKRMDEVD